MLCQSCSKNIANTHIKTVINGELKEYMLCSECAQKLGYLNPFDSFDSNLENFLGSFLGDGFQKGYLPDTVRCEKCGSSFADIARGGKVGCENCYSIFYEKMLPSIERMHGNARHVGKISSSAGSKAKLTNEIEKTKLLLKEAIDKQEFEQAAKLRDKIKEMQGDEKND